ncbi:MAG: ABC transporter permease [Candidatus Methanomethylophilaceae archaeon]|nr:ABC transporter permease [Candidatus Methanomethylophilaceae archaeon]
MKLFSKDPVPVDSEEYDRPRGTWESSGMMSDEEAHRNVRYEIPSVLYQTIFMFRTQMALYSKRKSIYFTLVMAVMIPLIYIGLKDLADFTILAESSGTGMIGLLLCMMPFVMALFTSFLCGTLVPSEFSERSAYMNMALPMSRVSFCLGKYLAGLVITIGVFIFAYGMAMAGTMTEYDFFDDEALAKSFVMTLLATLFFSSFSFMMGCLMNRGAALVSLVFMVFVLPLVELYLYANDMMSEDVFVLLPNLLPDMACLVLGSHFAASPVGSLNVIVNLIDASQFPILTCTAISVVCSIMFLVLGINAVNRREM